jgi:rod shape-determining protein MreD
MTRGSMTKDYRSNSPFLPWLRWSSQTSRFVNWGVIVVSVLLCLLALPTRLPGMELMGIGPNWLLIWVVAWSVKRSAVQGAFAGLILGLLQDGMSSGHPTHAWSLIIVGVLTALLQKQRYIQEDFISVALIVFGMAAVAETVMAIQFSIASLRSAGQGVFPTLSEIWMYHQQVTLACALLSSLWAPVVYFPLDRWWEKMRSIED